MFPWVILFFSSLPSTCASIFFLICQMLCIIQQPFPSQIGFVPSHYLIKINNHPEFIYPHFNLRDVIIYFPECTFNKYTSETLHYVLLSSSTYFLYASIDWLKNGIPTYNLVIIFRKFPKITRIHVAFFGQKVFYRETLCNLPHCYDKWFTCQDTIRVFFFEENLVI